MFLKFCVSQIVHFSNIAILKCSNSQIQHFSNSTILKRSNSQTEHFSNGAILKWNNFQIDHFSNGAILTWSNSQMQHFGVATLCHISRSQEQRNMACNVLLKLCFRNGAKNHDVWTRSRVMEYVILQKCFLLASSANHWGHFLEGFNKIWSISSSSEWGNVCANLLIDLRTFSSWPSLV